jgi:hypothetical protein
MKTRFPVLALLVLAPALFGADPDWKVGFNFRSSSGYVADGADEVYVLDDYSPATRTTANGNSATFNWVGNYISVRDRTTGQDRRLAGTHLYYAANNGTPYTFTITLPQAGDYIIRLALGDEYVEGGHGYQYVEVKDTSTVLLTVDVATLADNYFIDAAGTTWSAAAWPGSNAPVTRTFATTTCNVAIGPPTAQAGATRLAHLYLEYVPPANARRRVIIAQ